MKLSLIILSISILGYNPFYKLLFHEEVKITRWKKLTWDDFQGLANPFQKYDAAISSKVYVKYDSTSKKYYAYAGQNNQKSWKKASSIDYDDLLNHEQYHFNITEVHARMMNNYLGEYPTNTVEQHRTKLEELYHNLSEMQLKYDFETNHNLNFETQQRWEYKIDSMLHKFSSKPFFTVDSITGGAVFFPHQSEFEIVTEDDITYRIYELDKYGMSFTFVSYEFYQQKNKLKKRLDEIYNSDSLQISFVEIDSNKFEYERYVNYKDLLKETTSHHLWVYHKNYIYNLIVSYEGKSEDSEGFHKCTKTFMNSFHIKDLD